MSTVGGGFLKSRIGGGGQILAKVLFLLTEG